MLYYTLLACICIHEVKWVHMHWALVESEVLHGLVICLRRSSQCRTNVDKLIHALVGRRNNTMDFHYNYT